MSRKNMINLLTFAMVLIHKYGYDKYYDNMIIYSKTNKYNNSVYEKNMRVKCNNLDKNNRVLKKQ